MRERARVRIQAKRPSVRPSVRPSEASERSIRASVRASVRAASERARAWAKRRVAEQLRVETWSALEQLAVLVDHVLQLDLGVALRPAADVDVLGLALFVAGEDGSTREAVEHARTTSDVEDVECAAFKAFAMEMHGEARQVGCRMECTHKARGQVVGWRTV